MQKRILKTISIYTAISCFINTMAEVSELRKGGFHQHVISGAIFEKRTNGFQQNQSTRDLVFEKEKHSYGAVETAVFILYSFRNNFQWHITRRCSSPAVSRSKWNLEVLVIVELGKPELNPAKDPRSKARTSGIRTQAILVGGERFTTAPSQLSTLRDLKRKWRRFVVFPKFRSYLRYHEVLPHVWSKQRLRQKSSNFNF